ncbi:MAG: type I methionyl aminopeptidase [Flavobacteriales bacterium]|nr:type I methionyl aminopeptidase [Flavobacteriales bacterium]MCB9165965.1 type I methionyl aminopeptidase [Flavobacteriales bacterium]
MAKTVDHLSDEQIALVRESSLLVGRTLAEVARHLRPGATTEELDKVAEEHIRDHGGEPAFKGYNGFPASLCTSVNDQVVHGIPNDVPLPDGCIVSVDCGVRMNGFYGDSAYTFAVGEVDERVQRLMQVTYECLLLGIEHAVDGERTGDIGFAIQRHAESHRYGVVRELVGHGVGRELHVAPEVPNYGRRGHGVKLKEGMVIAIEPMINMGGRDVRQLEDGWTIITHDASPSAHFEHTVAVRTGKAEVLSTFGHIEDVLRERNMWHVGSNAEVAPR